MIIGKLFLSILLKSSTINSFTQRIDNFKKSFFLISSFLFSSIIFFINNFPTRPVAPKIPTLIINILLFNLINYISNFKKIKD